MKQSKNILCLLRSFYDPSAILRRSILLAFLAMSPLATLVSCNKTEEPSPMPQEQDEPIFQGKWYMPDYSWLWDNNLHDIEPYFPTFFKEQLAQQPDFYNITFKEISDTLYDGQVEWCEPSYDPVLGNYFFRDSYLYNIENSGATLALYHPSGTLYKRITITKLNNMEIMIDSVLYLRDKPNPTAMQPLPNGENWFYHTCDTQGVYYIGSNQFDLANPIFEIQGSELYVTYNPLVIDGIEGLYVVRPGPEYIAFTQQPHGCIDLYPFPNVSYTMDIVNYNGVQQYAHVQNSGFNPQGVLKYAMDGCKDVTSLVLGKLDIEEYAFWGCSLKSIFLFKGVEATASLNSFDDYTYEHTPLHIPSFYSQSSLPAPWSNFKHIYKDLPYLEL